MWIAWTLLAYFMIASRRYFKAYYNMAHAMHTLCGTCIVCITLIFGLKALADIDWTIETVKAHTFFGLFMLACVLIIAGLGALQSVYALYGQPKAWSAKPETHVRLASVHKYLARRILLIGFVTVSTGLA